MERFFFQMVKRQVVKLNNIAESYSRALSLHNAGRLAEAAAVYREKLDNIPRADSLLKLIMPESRFLFKLLITKLLQNEKVNIYTVFVHCNNTIYLV